jgi:general secretion pathway protein F
VSDTAYSYRAARKDGSMEFGVVGARSRDAASAALADRGVFPIDLSLEGTEEVARSRLSVADLALGLRVLASLSEAGLPIARALSALDDLAPAAWRPALPAIRDSVRGGQSLAAALSAAPLSVPPVVIGIIQAGESGSGVAAAVRRAADLMESAAATRAAIRAALAYPLILAVAGAASVTLLVGVVIPRFALILADLGQALPPTTRIVLGAAGVMRESAFLLFIVVAAVTLLWHVWSANPAGAVRWHELLLATPLVGRMRLAAGTARIASALAALLDSGVPISPALVHAARSAGDHALAARVREARESVIGGGRLGRALADARAMTPTALRLIRAGEESGRLATMVAHAGKLEGERADQMVRSAVRMLEPALILLFGGLVALVAAALLQAVYSVRPGT